MRAAVVIPVFRSRLSRREIFRGLTGDARRRAFSWSAFLLAWFAVVVSPEVVAAQDAPAVTLLVQPDSIGFGDDERARAIVVVGNDSQVPVREVRLRVLTPPGLEIVTSPPPLDQLPPHNRHVWEIDLRLGAGTLSRGRIELIADYRWGDAPSAGRGATTGAIDVAAVAPPSIEEVMSGALHTSLETLTEQAPGMLFVVVENKLGVPLHVGQLRASGPAFVKFEMAGFEVIPPPGGEGGSNRGGAEAGGDGEADEVAAFAVPPRQAAAIPVRVVASSRVVPGTHTFLLEIPVRWIQRGRQHSGQLHLTREVGVGVLGESEILEIFEVPSLLLLPGFLVMLTISMLWNRGVFREADTEFPYGLTSTEFWLLAVTVSFVMPFVYELVVGDNYLYGHGLADLVFVWFASVAAFGVGGYTVVAGLAWAVREYRRHQRAAAAARLTPTEDDEPIAVLRKLADNLRSLKRQPVRVTAGAESAEGYSLELPDEESADVWVCPQIRLHWEEGAAASLRKRVSRLLDPRRDQDPGELVRVLETGRGDGALRLSWSRGSGDLPGPRLVARGDIEVLRDAEVFVREA